jgi:hypothetical protein
MVHTIEVLRQQLAEAVALAKKATTARAPLDVLDAGEEAARAWGALVAALKQAEPQTMSDDDRRAFDELRREVARAAELVHAAAEAADNAADAIGRGEA